MLRSEDGSYLRILRSSEGIPCSAGGKSCEEFSAVYLPAENSDGSSEKYSRIMRSADNLLVKLRLIGEEFLAKMRNSSEEMNELNRKLPQMMPQTEKVPALNSGAGRVFSRIPYSDNNRFLSIFKWRVTLFFVMRRNFYIVCDVKLTQEPIVRFSENYLIIKSENYWIFMIRRAHLTFLYAQYRRYFTVPVISLIYLVNISVLVLNAVISEEINS